MCSTISCSDCKITSCPSLANIGDCIRAILYNPQKAIEIVQKWSDSNPIKTRQSEFLKLFPETHLVSDVINICPIEIDKRLVCITPKNCNDCKKNYWLTEVR